MERSAIEESWSLVINRLNLDSPDVEGFLVV